MLRLLTPISCMLSVSGYQKHLRTQSGLGNQTESFSRLKSSRIEAVIIKKVLHAATVIAKIEGDVSIAPDVLLYIASFVLVNGDLFGFVVYPCSCVATTESALAFIDLLRPIRDNHFDRAAMAA